jgi:hypothetical protein
MKKCPKCKSIFTDDELSYCLSDGTPLGLAFQTDETIQLPHFDISAEKTIPIATAPDTDVSVPTETRGSYPAHDRTNDHSAPPVATKHNFWAYTTIALLALVVGGGGGMYFFGTSRIVLPVNKTGRDLMSGEGSAATPTPETMPPETRPIPKSQPKTDVEPKADIPQGTFHVVNVAANDVLYIRPAPGNVKSSLGTIPPNATGISATGPPTQSGKALWLHVTYGGMTGWVNSRFLAKD